MKINQSIKNILFDLGGVILNIDDSLTIKAFNKLGCKDFTHIYSQPSPQQLFNHFEKGMISAKEFRAKLKSFLANVATDKEIDSAWNAMLLDLPVERLHFLNNLKQRFRLFLLSNTNEIHIDAYSAYLKNSFGIPNLSHLFEKEYYSYKIGMRKPDAEIFEFVLNENNLRAKETFFIDDSTQHITGARGVGIQTLLLEKGKTILDLQIE